MRDAVRAARDAYVAMAEARAIAPQRQVLPVEAERAVTLVMGGCVPGEGVAAKIVSVFPRNAGRGRPVISGLVAVLDPATGEPSAILDGTFLTARRTAAAAGAATDLLARADARKAAVIGCGAQAPEQLLALDTVRDLEQVSLFGRTRSKAVDLAERMEGRLTAALVVAGSVEEALSDADVVTCVTNSEQPVFAGSALGAGVHINAMGSFTLEMRELDTETVGRSRVFVDSVEAALAEAGELVAAERAGATRREDWIELGRVATGGAAGRSSAEEITLFKSVGQAPQDVVAASRALAAAEAAGRGVVVDL